MLRDQTKNDRESLPELRDRDADRVWLLGLSCVLPLARPQWRHAFGIIRLGAERNFRDDRAILLHGRRMTDTNSL